MAAWAVAAPVAGGVALARCVRSPGHGSVQGSPSPVQLHAGFGGGGRGWLKEVSRRVWSYAGCQQLMMLCAEASVEWAQTRRRAHYRWLVLLHPVEEHGLSFPKYLRSLSQSCKVAAF